MPKDVEQQDLDENSASTKRGGVLLRSAGSQGRGSKAARVAALLGTAGGMDLLCSSPCYAGCLCDAVALYVASTGQLIGLSFLIGAVTILFMKKWAISAKLAATGAIAIVLGSWVRDASYQPLAPGAIRNSGMDLEAHWFVLLLLVIATSITLLSAYIFPSIVAFRRHKHDRKKIVLLNIFLGWIPFVWNILLFLSFANEKKNK